MSYQLQIVPLSTLGVSPLIQGVSPLIQLHNNFARISVWGILIYTWLW